MHQTKKGNQWYFGMKAHLVVDSWNKLIHTAVATPVNVADGTVLPDLLHGNETRVWGDQAYRGQRAVTLGLASRANRLDQEPRNIAPGPNTEPCDRHERHQEWRGRSRQKVMQFCGPLSSLLHLPGISEGEGLR
jgi:IS5 family transposase